MPFLSLLWDAGGRDSPEGCITHQRLPEKDIAKLLQRYLGTGSLADRPRSGCAKVTESGSSHPNPKGRVGGISPGGDQNPHPQYPWEVQ